MNENSNTYITIEKGQGILKTALATLLLIATAVYICFNHGDIHCVYVCFVANLIMLKNVDLTSSAFSMHKNYKKYF